MSPLSATTATATGTATAVTAPRGPPVSRHPPPANPAATPTSTSPPRSRPAVGLAPLEPATGLVRWGPCPGG